VAKLLRTDSALMAHACILLGDLGRYEAARMYGSATLLCAQEAGADEGPRVDGDGEDRPVAGQFR
jgi:hypothetical protein